MTAPRYERIQKLSPGQFRRLTGVKPTVFAHMMVILKRAEKQKRKSGGRKPKLGLEDRLLMALEYLREYRTYFHIASNYGVSESMAYKTCRWIEDTLVKDKSSLYLERKRCLKAMWRMR